MSDTSSLSYGLGGYYCRYKMAGASACYAKRSGFLHFCDAVHVPPLPCRLPVCHLGRWPHCAGTHFLESDSRPLPRSYTCSICRHHGAAPHGGKCTQKNAAARPVVTGWMFEGGDTFFQKCLLAYLKGPVLL